MVEDVAGVGAGEGRRAGEEDGGKGEARRGAGEADGADAWVVADDAEVVALGVVVLHDFFELEGDVGGDAGGGEAVDPGLRRQHDEALAEPELDAGMGGIDACKPLGARQAPGVLRTRRGEVEPAVGGAVEAVEGVPAFGVLTAGLVPDAAGVVEHEGYLVVGAGLGEGGLDVLAFAGAELVVEAEEDGEGASRRPVP